MRDRTISFEELCKAIGLVENNDWNEYIKFYMLSESELKRLPALCTQLSRHLAGYLVVQRASGFRNLLFFFAYTLFTPGDFPILLQKLLLVLLTCSVLSAVPQATR